MAKKKKQPFSYHLGNLLMALGLIAAGFVYYPLLQLYLHPPQIKAELPSSGFYLTIPKISAQAPIIERVDAFNQAEYRWALEQGVAHAKQSSLPGESKTVYLFAHSSDSPWRITRYNTIFLRLGELDSGDQIKLTKDGKEYLYQVVDKRELWPNEIGYLTGSQSDKLTSDTSQTQGSPKEVLILQTCTPIGTAFKRLLVFANPI